MFAKGDKNISFLKDEIASLKKKSSDLEANYRYVLDGMASCMAVYQASEDGQDFIFKDFNRAAELSSHLDCKDVVGKSVSTVFPGVTELGLLEVFKRVYKTGIPEHHPVSQYKDQRIALWVENYVYKLPTGEIVAIYEDYTSRKQSEENLKQRIAELEAINAMSRAVSMNISLNEVVEAAIDQLMITITPDLVLVYMLENSEMRLQTVKCSHKIPIFAKQQKSVLNIGECLCGIAAIENKSVFSPDINKDTRCINSECKMAGIKSYTSLPLVNRDKTIGVLGIGSCQERNFESQASFLQSLSALIASAIANTLLHQQVMSHADELEKTVEHRTAELRKFFNAVESSPASIIITDSEGSIEYANPFFFNLTGYTPEEAKGKNPRMLKSGVHTKDFYEQMWKTLLAGRTWRGEICNRKKNGELYWEQVSISPLQEDNSIHMNSFGIKNEPPANLVNFVGVKEDITERKIAEKMLRESEQRYKTIFNMSRDGIIIADLQNRNLIVCNDAASNMLGYEEGELIGKNLMDIHPPADFIYVLRQFELQSKSELVYAMELPCLKKDGTIFYCDVSATPVTIDERSCLMGFFRDITEKKKSQELREDVERILRHDLKSPLNAVIGFPQVMMENDNLTDSQKQYLKLILNAGQNMLDMIELSLTIYQIEMGSYKYSPGRFDLLDVIKQCMSDNESSCKSKEITISLSANGADINYLETLKFSGERLLAFSVLSNLIINAVEASPCKETVKITVEPLLPEKISKPEPVITKHKNDLARPEPYIMHYNKRDNNNEISKTDTHPAVRVNIHNKGSVPFDIREKFFDKYVTSGKAKGTGLGTYSAKLLSTVQGWDITMQTSEEAGTDITISNIHPVL